MDNKSEAESSPELDTPSEIPQYQEIKDLSVQDGDDLKDNIKSEPKETKCESQSEANLEELSYATSDSIITQDSTLNEPAKAATLATTVKMLDHSSAPSVDGQITNARQSFKEDQEIVADAGGLHEFAEVAAIPEQHLSRSNNSIITNQNSGLVDTGENFLTALSQFENTADIGDQDSLTKEVNVISNDIVKTQSENINLPLNKEENQNSNETVSIQNVDIDTIKKSDIDNVELTTISDGTVNNNEEDPQETNTFDISFKESPTVELQDSQINSDMLEPLLETNADSDIVTLLTQDSTNAELNSNLANFQQNAFIHNIANAEIPEGNCDRNGIISVREELQENTQPKNVMNNIDLIENNKENDTIDNNGDENTSMNEAPQIPNQDGNMDLETAAVTIQKVFRTFLFKSRASIFDDAANDETIFLNEADKNKVILKMCN